MLLSSTFTRLAVRPHLPRRTVRLRLTLLYGALFLASGAALLAITYVLVQQALGPIPVKAPGGVGQLSIVASGAGITGVGGAPTPEQVNAIVHAQHSSELNSLIVQSAIALAIMTVFSIGLGWLVAGSVLAPLRTMTHRARRMSEHNLGERLALEGPDDELKDLADTIDGLLTRLEAAFAAQRRFVANASHELRTPLAMMRTSVDVATGKPAPVPSEVHALAAKVREGLDQGERLLESFLMLARAQHGALPDRAAVSLASLVEDALDAKRATIQELGITLEEEIGDAPLVGSRTLLARMLDNLVDNAVRHNRPLGWIRVASAARGDRARIVVESSGPPLDADAVRELAQPFRRLAAERTGSDRGVGLGLSIVAQVAAAHGGALELSARGGGGLRAVIELPLALAPAAVEALA